MSDRMQTHTRPAVTIIIPTFNRHDGLERCVRSLFALQDAGMASAELIVADNSADANAEQLFNRLAQDAPIGASFVSETAAGVANVRNTALIHANASLVLWLDDDQSVENGWLDAFISDYKAYGAAVTFGPIRTRMPEGAVIKYDDYFARYFERAQRAEGGLIDVYYGCGNSMFDLDQVRRYIPQDADIFPTEANDSGGEDDLVFQMIEQQGGRFCWSPKGWANEHPPVQRLKLDYTFKRSFVYGQGPISDAMHKSPPDVLSIIYWMGVGFGQMAVYGVIASVLRLGGSDQWVHWGDKTMRGAGKVLWFPPFQLKFYGTSYNKRNKKVAQKDNTEAAPAEDRSQPAN